MRKHQKRRWTEEDEAAVAQRLDEIADKIPILLDKEPSGSFPTIHNCYRNMLYRFLLALVQIRAHSAVKTLENDEECGTGVVDMFLFATHAAI